MQKHFIEFLNSGLWFLQIFFKNRYVDNEGYVLFVRKNALQVLIPKYGLEATLYLDSKTVTFEYDEQVISGDSADLLVYIEPFTN